MSDKHLFFDLDRTLWDYETNVRETLEDLYDSHLCNLGVKDTDTFARVFRFENGLLWDAFTKNKIDKDYLRKFRFLNTLNRLGINDTNLALKLEVAYLAQTPVKKKLLPGVHETLSELGKRYTMHIITNGFEDAQNFKLVNSGIRNYFSAVITSDGANARKPNKEIFDYSMELTGANCEDCIMIGDDPEIDIVGAQNAGWRGILYNSLGCRHTLIDHTEINALPELLDIL